MPSKTKGCIFKYQIYVQNNKFNQLSLLMIYSKTKEEKTKQNFWLI